MAVPILSWLRLALEVEQGRSEKHAGKWSRKRGDRAVDLGTATIVASRCRGSRYGSLLVAVPLPPERGRATKAALKLLASTFGVPPSRVELVGGATSREKVVKIYGRHDTLSSRLAELIEGRVELER
jgi:uncharacterized protein YggU (UPF0235/DUF167 family)